MKTTHKYKNPSSSFHELALGLTSWRIWLVLAIQDILSRYRGSFLGPFWITISTGITISCMGLLYGVLFKVDRSNYLPFFTTGMVSWTFITMVTNELTKIFIDSKPYIENIRVSPIVHIFRVVLRNLIILLHNLPIVLLVVLIYPLEINRNILLFFPGFFILCLNGVLYGTVIAFLSTRFPDIGSVISSFLQVLFFITPIMWSPSLLPQKYHIVLMINPFYYLVSLLRNPLLSQPFTPTDQIGILLLTICGFFLFSFAIKSYMKRVVFWL